MGSSTPERIEIYRQLAKYLAEAGARVGARYFRQRVDNNDTHEPGELLSMANQEIVGLMQREIRRQYPDHLILDDVSCQAQSLEYHQCQTWIIDCLDGEKNFAVGFPYFCCSVSFYAGGQCQAASVADALHGDTFSYGHGIGSFLNDRRFHTSAPPNPRHAILSVSWASHLSENVRELNTVLYERIVPIFSQQRRAGSIALDLCYIAIGRFGGLYAYDPALIDLAAGLPIALGAGCRATDFEGLPFVLGKKTLVVASEPVMEVLLPQISGSLDFNGK
jgi:myo-inositol-1(or 4)-monophosphatase